MENYQPFFPFQSSSSPSSSLSLNMVNINPHADNTHEHQYHQVSGNNKSNGFLGLMSEMEVSGTTTTTTTTANTKTVSHSSENDLKLAGGKKKGEKKVRKPRYAFQTRSQVDILDDGYRWRKYGQKAVKNNKFPRCTHQGCNVKKQVQRLTKDEGVVVTTYEGMHSHPIEKSTDNFEHILSQMQIYTTF
ncbi:hypothetical protein FEM48_Zijuj10G0029300 [Ziziphus jujuba var. spinosa]|uniref:WRKY domain-containing protein n=1 Tax=Ziziphus jujuba var. spinosa TaxID=714518 RepID=A0A978UKW3_ZIZJJ|nr:hypothetical protein FEM48_Zijuj10G0029300 [Ziziphus jujuba var. spinosa]